MNSFEPGEEYRRIRQEGLQGAKERGIEVADKSATATAFASDTSEYGLDYRDDLQQISDDRVPREAARFVGYELSEAVRKAGMNEILTDEDVNVRGDHGVTESQLEDLYRAFTMVDRLQRGYTDVRPEEEYDGNNRLSAERFPNPLGDDWVKDQIAAIEESGTIEPDSLGVLNSEAILVVNDDWIRYRRDHPPKSVDEEYREDVFNFLKELGVAQQS